MCVQRATAQLWDPVFGVVMRSRSRLGSTGDKSNLTERASIQLAPLTIEEVRKLPKPHAGFEAYVEPLAQIVQSYPNDLGTGLDVAAMRAELTSYEALVAEITAAQNALARLENMRVQLGASVWGHEMLIYSRARSVGRTNAELRFAIQPFEKFMKNGPHKKTAAPPTPGTPSTP
jgi:hypothetical protein